MTRNHPAETGNKAPVIPDKWAYMQHCAVALFTLLALFTVSPGIPTSPANAAMSANEDIPCKRASLETTARCLAKQPGLHPRGGINYALSILRCEGGIDRASRTSGVAKPPESGGQRTTNGYGGAWQLSAAEVRSFDNGISREWHQRINPMGLNNGYRQTVAVFYHRDWSWSSCA